MTTSRSLIVEEEVISLLGETAIPDRRRRNCGVWLGSSHSRVQIAMASLVLGLVATAGWVTVQRDEVAPTSHSWIQQLYNLAGSGDPHVAMHTAAGAANGYGGNKTVLRVPKLAQQRTGRRRIFVEFQTNSFRHLNHRRTSKKHIGGKARQGGGSAGAVKTCLLYTSPSPRDATLSRMPSSA